MRLPNSLNRRALKKCFPKVGGATWDYLFDYEKHNGLYELRVPGPGKYPFYSTVGVTKWLANKGYYTPADFSDLPRTTNPWSGLASRTHALV